MSLLKEELIWGGTFLAFCTAGGGRESRGEEKGIFLTFFLVTPFLRFLAVISFPAVER